MEGDSASCEVLLGGMDGQLVWDKVGLVEPEGLVGWIVIDDSVSKFVGTALGQRVVGKVVARTIGSVMSVFIDGLLEVCEKIGSYETVSDGRGVGMVGATGEIVGVPKVGGRGEAVGPCEPENPIRNNTQNRIFKRLSYLHSW